MVPPEFGPKKERGPHSNPITAGNRRGIASPRLTGAFLHHRQSLAPSGSSLGRGSGGTLPVTASYIGVFYHLFPACVKGARRFFLFPSGAAGFSPFFHKRRVFVHSF